MFQLRLDFSSMTLAQPESTDNKCSDDQFIGQFALLSFVKRIRRGEWVYWRDLLLVSGGSPVPAICGTNTGAHSEYIVWGFAIQIAAFCLIIFLAFFLPGWFANSLIFYAVYVDMGLSSNSPVVLTVVTSGQSFARSFSVKVGHVFVFVFVFSLCCKFALALGQAGVHYVLEKTRPGEKYFLKITLTHKPWLIQGSWWEGRGSIFCTKSIMQSSLTFRDP